MGKCYFVSDLHLLARHSVADKYLEKIVRAASRAEIFILGGDIFDFRWAATATPQGAVDQAVAWLELLATACPRCHFHFLLGNHDYHQRFIEGLGRLQQRLANFSWHRFYLRLGSSVFLHGDMNQRRTTARGLAARRSRWLHRKRRGPLLGHLYDLVMLSRVHSPLPYMVHRRRRVAKRILRYLEDVGEGPETGVKNVYFGHTHRVVSHYRCGGLTFHNGGASIRGNRFRIVEAVT